MAKVYIHLLVLSCTAYVTMASVGHALPNPQYPGKCFDGKNTYDIGTYYPANECTMIECKNDYYLYTEGCGSVGAPEGFKNIPDLTKKYPHCCINLVKINEAE